MKYSDKARIHSFFDSGRNCRVWIVMYWIDGKNLSEYYCDAFEIALNYFRTNLLKENKGIGLRKQEFVRHGSYT